jgi:hypothetical protein
MSVIANIDDSTPTGRKIVKELEKHKRVVKLSYSQTEEIPEDCVPLEEGIEEFWRQLESKFGYDIRTIEQ